MSSENAQNTTLAGIYAEAIAPLATQAGGDEFLDEIQQVSELLSQQAELVQWLDNPVVDKRVRAEVVAKAFGSSVGRALCDTLAVLARRGRLHLLDDITAELERILLTQKGIACVEVHTAGAIDPQMADEIQSALENSYGCEVRMELKVDKALLGGLVIKNGDDLTDLSLRRDFDSIVNRMRRR